MSPKQQTFLEFARLAVDRRMWAEAHGLKEIAFGFGRLQEIWMALAENERRNDERFADPVSRRPQAQACHE